MAVQSKSIKALILDFDRTLFNTDADREVRKNSKGKDWDLIYSKIPEYKLYDGWHEVFAWAKDNNIKIGIVSTAKTELINKTLEYFGLACDAVVGWQLFVRKPSGKLVDMAIKKLKVAKENVVSIGDSIIDKQMSDNGGVRFIGAIWDSEDVDELKECICLSTPSEIMNVTI